MTQNTNHGFALHSVELELRGDKILTRSRPLDARLPDNTPVLNPRGMLLEQGASLLERKQASLIVLTNGTSKDGEPLLDYIGYLGTCNEPYFTDVQPTSLYRMSDAFYRVSVVSVALDAAGYHEDSAVHEALFLISRDGVLKPFEKSGAVMWPQSLLDAVTASLNQQPHADPMSYQVATADDVKLDTLYLNRQRDHSGQSHDTFECYVVCKSENRQEWLGHAKDVIRSEVVSVRSQWAAQLETLDDALMQLA